MAAYRAVAATIRPLLDVNAQAEATQMKLATIIATASSTGAAE